MCECCQGIVSIAVLTAEHDEIRVVASEALRGLVGEDTQAARDTAREAAGRLLELLGPHLVVEEQGLFPALVEEFPDHIATLEQEHRRIARPLTAVASGTWPEGWLPQLTDALRLLQPHVLKEQDGLFPAALIAMSTEQWCDVEQVRQRAGCALAVSAH
jgi:hemerythrin-like domain-containing protein